jgi:hypothetical protein
LWVMMYCADLPSGDKNSFRPRWKSGFSNASGARKKVSSLWESSNALPMKVEFLVRASC